MGFFHPIPPHQAPPGSSLRWRGLLGVFDEVADLVPRPGRRVSGVDSSLGGAWLWGHHIGGEATGVKQWQG